MSQYQPRIRRAVSSSGKSAPSRPSFTPTSTVDGSARALHSFGQLALTAPAVQRCACQDKKDQDSAPQNVQFKLTVNTPGDAYEQEADATADQVMRMSAPSAGSLVQREGPREDDELQMKPLPGASLNLLQRCACEDEAQRQEAGQASGGGDLANTDVSGVVSSGLASGGRPLDPATRSFMEPRFGHDFSSVRIHDNAAASSSAQSVAARAYTVGSNIAFRSGEFAPGSSEGRRLLAHELTHVVQQGASAPLERSVQRALWVSELTGPSIQRRDVGVQRDDDDFQAGGTTAPDATATTSTDTTTTTSPDPTASAGATTASTNGATGGFLACVNDQLASMGILSEIGTLTGIGCGIAGVVGGIAGTLVEPGGGTLTAAGLALVGCLAFATGIEAGKIGIAVKACVS